MDNRGAHTAHRLRWPEHVRCVGLPPSCPERKPIARLWRDLKDALAWQPFMHLDAQHNYGGDLLRAYEAPTLQSRTGYAYLVDAIHALGP